MTKDELLKIVDKNTYCASNYFAIISAVEAYTKASNGANPMLAVVFRPEESEFRTQKHLMDAEGTTDTEPSKEAVFNYVKSCGYYADAIDVWYDTMQHIWRWSCNIIEVSTNNG
jgi:hypothetical protein